MTLTRMCEQAHKEKLLQGIQSVNGLKARSLAIEADGTALTLTTQ